LEGSVISSQDNSDLNMKSLTNPYENQKGYEAEAETVRNILQELNDNDPELYEYINNLSYVSPGGYNTSIRAVIWLSLLDRNDNDNELRGHAKVHYGIKVDPQTLVKYNGKDIYLPGGYEVSEDRTVIKTKTANRFDKKFGVFNIVLYVMGQNASSLANEFGDIMFSIEENELARDEILNGDRRSYDEKLSTKYSFAVQKVYKERAKKDFSKDSDLYPLKVYLGNEDSRGFYANDGTLITKL
jgi:hypothetical protein